VNSRLARPGGSLRSYSLDFGDGTEYEWKAGDKTSGTGPVLTHTHTYARAGIYDVTLAVTDDREEASEAYATATIADPAKPPKASAGGPYDGIVAADVFFDGRASSDDGGIVKYRWNFGDAAIGAGVTPSHKYTVPGTYKVTLRVTDTDGQTARATALVRITPAPPKP
jgi:PKD repeat protein